jgi:hypothetical protein
MNVKTQEVICFECNTEVLDVAMLERMKPTSDTVINTVDLYPIRVYLQTIHDLSKPIVNNNLFRLGTKTRN